MYRQAKTLSTNVLTKGRRVVGPMAHAMAMGPAACTRPGQPVLLPSVPEAWPVRQVLAPAPARVTSAARQAVHPTLRVLAWSARQTAPLAPSACHQTPATAACVARRGKVPPVLLRRNVPPGTVSKASVVLPRAVVHAAHARSPAPTLVPARTCRMAKTHGATAPLTRLQPAAKTERVTATVPVDSTPRRQSAPPSPARQACRRPRERAAGWEVVRSASQGAALPTSATLPQ